MTTEAVPPPGEGANAGSPAVFCRFSGCNLWTGREADREAAVCNFCDTDFVGTDGPGGGKFADAEDLAGHVEALWGEPVGDRLVVVTGGEPMLQLDPPLIDALHARGFAVAVESNGTLPAPPGIDWLCVSPKAGTEVPGGRPRMRSTSGRAICSTNCRAYALIASRNRRCPSAKTISNASVLLPEPLTPVTTTNFPRGMAMLRFFRLCSRAP